MGAGFSSLYHKNSLYWGSLYGGLSVLTGAPINWEIGSIVLTLLYYNIAWHCHSYFDPWKIAYRF